MTKTPNFEQLVSQFAFRGEFLDAQPYGLGHINDTYALNFRHNGDNYRYILQRINQQVFKEPEAVMENMTLVTQHLRQKIQSTGGDPERETIYLIPTVDGKAFLKTANEDYWRAETFIENATSYQIAPRLTSYYHAAKAYGSFIRYLEDLPLDQIQVTIPDFHNTPKRYQALMKAAKEDIVGKADLVREEIGFVLQRKVETETLIGLLENDEIPQRITHNDAKLNNILLDDKTGEAVCVIDLDTVMPGLSLYDFGDLVRSSATSAEEDEANLSQVKFDPGIFEQIVNGFLDATLEILTPAEIRYLAYSARLITLENGTRFLTDYLSGDTYFKIDRQNHNLDRARNQFKLVREMEDNFDLMETIVKSHAKQLQA